MEYPRSKRVSKSNCWPRGKQFRRKSKIPGLLAIQRIFRRFVARQLRIYGWLSSNILYKTQLFLQTEINIKKRIEKYFRVYIHLSKVISSNIFLWKNFCRGFVNELLAKNIGPITERIA